MAGRGPQSFRKRQKEEQRKERQLAKVLRRRQANASSQALQGTSENPAEAEQALEQEPRPTAPPA
jgi:hypothetical protein